MLKKKIKLSLILIIFISLIQNAFSLEPNIFVQSTVNIASQELSNDSYKSQKSKCYSCEEQVGFYGQPSKCFSCETALLNK